MALLLVACLIGAASCAAALIYRQRKLSKRRRRIQIYRRTHSDLVRDDASIRFDATLEDLQAKFVLDSVVQNQPGSERRAILTERSDPRQTITLLLQWGRVTLTSSDYTTKMTARELIGYLLDW